MLRIREEELLSTQAVGPDGLLPRIRENPIDEGLSRLRLHFGMLGRIDQDNAVLVEQAVIAFDEDLEVSLILKADPCPAIGHDISAHSDAGVERGAHARPRLAIPGPADPGDR